MEHGGTAFAYIDSSADIASSTDALVKSSFYHAGQVCVSTQNILIHKNVEKEFLKSFLVKTSKLKCGDPQSMSTDVGPIIKDSAYNRILDQIEKAVKSGAELLLGGKPLSETIIEPTVFLNPEHDLEIVFEEIFGPVVNLFIVNNIDEAIEFIGDSHFSFQASIYTQDMNQGLKAINEFNAKTVLVNEHTAYRVDWMPLGEEKNSGYSTASMYDSMMDMTYEKLFIIKSPEINE